jgi:hypothetical protein
MKKFTIESESDEEDREDPNIPIIILSNDDNNNTPHEMNIIVINAFPDDHFLREESACLLSDRVVGTMGFCGALALLSATCCCFCSGLHRQELANTHNRFTLFGLCCSV